MSSLPTTEAALAKLAEAQRLQGEALAELARELEAARHANEWVSQRNSPLGSRAHRELARAGAFPSSRVGKLVLVRRSDLDAYIASSRPPPPKKTEPGSLPTVDEQLEEILHRRVRTKRAQRCAQGGR